MDDLSAIHAQNSRVQATRWVMDARWYYATLAALLGVVSSGQEERGPEDLWIILGAFLVVLLLNVGCSMFTRGKRALRFSEARARLVHMVQVGVDLGYFYLILAFTGGGVGSIAHSFFFAPIIVAVIVFGARGALLVAAFSGLLIFLTAAIDAGIIEAIFSSELMIPRTGTIIEMFTKVGVIFLMYLLVAFLGGYTAKLIRARDVLLLEKLKQEEGHIGRLEELTKEFDRSAKLLVRRDIELSQLNDKLKQLDQMKSEIISVVAHQLRTPLSAIKWTLKMLVDGDMGAITPEQKDILEKGFESNERMIMLVNDMLSVDRMESGKVKYSFIPVQFEELIQGMIRDLAPLATQKNVRVVYVGPGVVLPKIKLDPDKMRDVLQNLFDNAIKYSRNDTEVNIILERNDSEYVLHVKDAGIGIPESERDKIFSRFFRATNAVRTETNGSGLGLFIAQSIVKRHGGRIWFESVPEQGTTFHVSLPYSA
jgi:signal transduction histidine kinase